MSERHTPRRATFRASDLRLIREAPPPDVPPLTIGDRCMLNSGGPVMTVVDLSDIGITASWRSGEAVDESDFPRACVRRVAP